MPLEIADGGPFLVEMDTNPYQIINLTPERQVWLSILDLPRLTHPMYGLLEVDVTVPRQLIAGHKARSGETLSFTGYLIRCLARAVDENKAVQAYRKGRRQLVQFDEVDVGLMIERQIGDKRTLSGHVVRDAGHKTYREIHEEIRLAQSAVRDQSAEMPSWFRTALLIPWPFSRLVKAVLSWGTRLNPTATVSVAGTVGITAVGMFGKGHSGWGFEVTRHSLALVVGSTTWKPAIIDGRVEPREILNLTVIFDHDIVDGAPAARFTKRLVELIESGHELDSIED
jgi:pyruvate/2-oxoglutarate dehydrogenase complex dihydrolipoamide acyltransferase (E2) component